jgi:CheY-like chemotaxis protein
VEDDHAVRSLVKEILEHHGYLVIEAETGDSALTNVARIREALTSCSRYGLLPAKNNGLELAPQAHRRHTGA